MGVGGGKGVLGVFGTGGTPTFGFTVGCPVGGDEEAIGPTGFGGVG